MNEQHDTPLGKEKIAAELVSKFDYHTLKKILADQSPSASQEANKRRIYGMNNKFSGKMFLDEASSGKLLKDGIFCTNDKYAIAEKATSTTMAARRLMDGVFSQEALINCSITELPPRGKGKASYENKPNEVKPYLCPRAVSVIVDTALDFQKKFHWNPKRDAAQVRHAMSVRLREAALRQPSGAE